jgi:hypothetical protein
MQNSESAIGEAGRAFVLTSVPAVRPRNSLAHHEKAVPSGVPVAD